MNQLFSEKPAHRERILHDKMRPHAPRQCPRFASHRLPRGFAARAGAPTQPSTNQTPPGGRRHARLRRDVTFSPGQLDFFASIRASPRWCHRRGSRPPRARCSTEAEVLALNLGRPFEPDPQTAPRIFARPPNTVPARPRVSPVYGEIAAHLVLLCASFFDARAVKLIAGAFDIEKIGRPQVVSRCASRCRCCSLDPHIALRP